MLVCLDDISVPNNFTVFLTPPVNDDDGDNKNANLLKLAVQKKYYSTDLLLLTKMDIIILMRAPDLKHHLKNIAGWAEKCFGEDLIVNTSLKQIASHIENKESSYNYEFKQETLFGENFLDRINWQLHHFFDSWDSGDTSNIDIDKLDFSDMLEQVEMREHHSKLLERIRKLMKK